MTILQELANRLDVFQFRPRGIGAVEVCPIVEDGRRRYILKNTRRKTFIKLSEAEYVLWQKMDGSRSVQDLHTVFYEEFHVLPGDRLIDLVVRLRDRYFLEGVETGVFTTLSLALARRATLIGALSRELRIPRADAVVAAVYRYGGWLAFTRVGALLLALVGAGGAYGVWWALAERVYSPWSLGGSVVLALVAYAGAAVVVTGVHEVAHALAVKHYGREVIHIRCVMLAGVFPLASVDTTDMHMVPSRRAKVVVSLAGPGSHVVTGGFAMMAAAWLASGPGGHALFILALYAYGFLALPALYPGRNSDWYNVISDAGGVSQLGRRSEQFLQRDLWRKLRGRQSFTHQERILILYATVLRAWWVAFLLVAVWVALRGRWLVHEVWATGGWPGRPIVLTGALLMALVGGMLLAAAFRRAVLALRRAGWLARPLALLRRGLAGLASATVIGPGSLLMLGQEVWALGALAAVAAAGGVAAVWLTVRGRSPWPDHPWHAVQAWFAAVAVLLAARLAVAAWFAGAPAPLWPLAVELAAAAAALAGAARAYHDRGVDTCTARERRVLLGAAILTVVVLAVALAAATAFVHAPSAVAAARLGSAALLAMALSLLGPSVLDFMGTTGAGRWNGTAVACGALALGAILEVLASGRVNGSIVLVAGAVATVALCHDAAVQLVAFRRMRFAWDRGPDAIDPDERHAIARAVETLLAHAVANVARLMGARAAGRLEDAFNQASANDDLALRLCGARVQHGIPDDADIAEVLRIARRGLVAMTALVGRVAGTAFAHEVMAHGAGSLSWVAREALTNWLGPDGLPWRMAARTPAEPRPAALTALLASVPFLQTLPGEALARVAALLTIRTCGAGETIFAEGAPGDDFYLVLSGKVDIVRTPGAADVRVMGTVGPGDYFGEVALFEDVPRAASARAGYATQLAVLSGRDFRQHVMPHVPREAHGSWNLIRMLRRLPLFREFDWTRLLEIATRFRREHVEAGLVLIRQGESGTAFYVIGEGRVEVSVASGAGDGPATPFATLGPGECFGELALLYDRPRSAMVRTLAACELFVLGRADFQAYHAQLCRPDGPALQLASRRAYGLGMVPRKRAELEPSRFLEHRADPLTP